MCCLSYIIYHISYIIYINMMNRILYSTGCAVFAPIPLADTRPCHLIVAKKRETLKHALLVMIFTLDNVIQCDTMCMFCCHVLSVQNSCHIQLDNNHIMGWSKKAMSAKPIFNSFQHGEILWESVLGFQQQWVKDVDRSL